MARTRLHFVGYHPAHSVQARAVDVLAGGLARRLGDEIEFRFDPDIGDLGHKAFELLDMVESGRFDLCYFYSSYLADRVPELGLFELPFQISGREAAYALLDGDVGHRITASIAANTGYRLLACWDNGIRHISNARHAIRRPADCRGLSMRTARNDIHQAAFRALGFEPLFLDVKELGEAARTGRIDAQENPLTNIRNYGLQRYHRHITLTGHLFGISAVLANASAHASWPRAVRDALDAAMIEATAAERRFAAEEDAICTEQLTAGGTVITPLSDLERACFADAVRPVVEAERAKFEPQLLAAFDAGRG